MKDLQMPQNCGASGSRKKCRRKFKFLIDLAIIAMVAEDTKSIENEPQKFSKVWNNAD